MCDTEGNKHHKNPDKLICLLVLNLKMSITKVTGVSFGTPTDYMLPNLKIMALCSSASKDRITFYLCSYSKLVSPIILHFTKIKPLKVLKNAFYFT